MRAARVNLRKVWSDKARAAALAARRGDAPSGGSTPGETVDQAKAKANAYIAAHPNDFLPKGTKKPKAAGKGAGKGKAAKDPAAAKAKAAKEAQSQAEHAQRLKEHTEDRAQRQADRETRQKEHAQSQAEHEQTRAEHEADRQSRLKAQADKAKAKAGASGKKSGGGSKGSSKADAKRQERLDSQKAKADLQNTASAFAGGGQVTPEQMQRLVTEGLAKPRAYGGIELTGLGRSAAKRAQKMSKVAGNINSILEQTGLQKRTPDPKRAHARAIEAQLLAKADLPDLAQAAEQSLRKYL